MLTPHEKLALAGAALAAVLLLLARAWYAVLGARETWRAKRDRRLASLEEHDLRVAQMRGALPRPQGKHSDPFQAIPGQQPASEEEFWAGAEKRYPNVRMVPGREKRT